MVAHLIAGDTDVLIVVDVQNDASRPAISRDRWFASTPTARKALSASNARRRTRRSDPQAVLSEQLHRGRLRAFFTDLVGEHDPGTDGQFGKRSDAVAMLVTVTRTLNGDPAFLQCDHRVVRASSHDPRSCPEPQDWQPSPETLFQQGFALLSLLIEWR